MIEALGRAWSSSPKRTFLLLPAATVALELLAGRPAWRVRRPGLALMAAGYVLYRAAGAYRQREGGGGPGFVAKPDHLVTTGPYAIVRNPMYLGHLLSSLGLLVATRSPFALVALTLQWQRFSGRVALDEERLAARFGPAYADYLQRVPRWIPRIVAADRTLPPYVLFHRVAEPGSAAVRLLIVELGLKPKIDFQNALTDGAEALRSIGGDATPALWDGGTLVVGTSAVTEAVRRIIPTGS